MTPQYNFQTIERLDDQLIDAELKLLSREDALDLIEEKAEALQSALEEYEATAFNTVMDSASDLFKAADLRAKALGILTAAVLDMTSTVRGSR